MAAGLRCGSTTIKYLLFLFNFLFTILGLAILVIGGLGLSKLLKSGETLNSGLIFVIVVGAFIFMVAFFGCCGAVRESHCMLVTFACLLLGILVCEVIAAILIFVGLNDIDKTVDEVFNEAKKGDKDYMDIVNSFQENAQCCGVIDVSFWGNKIPDSCCPNKTGCTAQNSYDSGCSSVFSDLVNTFGKAAGAVAIVIAVIEVIGVWFALALAGEIKSLSRG